MGKSFKHDKIKFYVFLAYYSEINGTIFIRILTKLGVQCMGIDIILSIIYFKRYTEI